MLNASILLFKRIDEWGKFTVEFTKARGFKSPDEFVVLTQHDKDTGACRLIREPKNLANTIETLMGDGMMQKDIAKELGVSEATVSRIVTKEIRPRQQLEGRERGRAVCLDEATKQTDAAVSIEHPNAVSRGVCGAFAHTRDGA